MTKLKSKINKTVIITSTSFSVPLFRIKGILKYNERTDRYYVENTSAYIEFNSTDYTHFEIIKFIRNKR